MKQWCSLVEDNGEIHVFPLDDLYEHETEGLDCWCSPWLDDHIIVHNAADGRTKHERS